MCNDWEITHERQDLPPHVWQFIKDKGFLGMIIPKKYGGLGFSRARALGGGDEALDALGTAAISVMVPNSLGPARAAAALRHRRAEEPLPAAPRARASRCPASRSPAPRPARTRPRSPTTASCARASGRARKCSACASPGTSATSRSARSRRCSASLSGSTIPTTCSATRRISASPARWSRPTRPGVNIGRRHLPLNAAFQNGPNWGKDVFMPIDWIIGGREYAGKGWMMLMDCLAAGRAISLPTLVGRRRQGADALHRRLRARARAVQDADRQARRRRGGARPHRRHTAT